MKKKKIKLIVCSGISLATTSLISCFGLVTMNSQLKTSNLIPTPHQKNRILSNNQTKSASSPSNNNATTIFCFEKSTDQTYYIVKGFNKGPKVIDITIPEKYKNLPVKKIAPNAFKECHLRNVSIPGSVNEIGARAFFDSPIDKLIFGEGLQIIGDEAFAESLWQTEVNIPRSVISIGNEAFKNSFLNKLTLHEGLQSIGKQAFERCTELTEVDIPSSVTTIGDEAFKNSPLNKLTLHEGLQSIGKQAFERCTELTEVDIPSSVTTIGDEAFANCRRLSKINIPKQTPNIGTGTFFGASGLKNIFVSSSVKTIASQAFVVPQNSELTLTLISENLSWADDFISIQDWEQTPSDLKVWTISDDVKERLINYKIDGKNLFKKENVKTLIPSGDVYIRETNSGYMVGLTKSGRSHNEIIVPATVNHIADFAFSECPDNVKNIKIESNQITFSDRALYAVPKNIDYYVKNFQMADSLKKIGINKNHIFVNAHQFVINLDGMIQYVNPSAVSDHNVTVGKEFQGITIKGISPGAFRDCKDDLTTITFSGDCQATQLSQKTFADLASTTNYYVKKENQSMINALITNAKVSADHVVFSGDQFDVSKSNLIIKVHWTAIQGAWLTIPRTYQGIGPDALSDEYYGTLARVTFESGSRATRIDPNAFREGTSANTDYYVSQADQGVVNALTDQAKISADHIVFSGIQFDVSKSNLIIKVHLAAIYRSKLIIPRTYQGIGHDALNEYDGTLARVTFESGSQATRIDPNAFRRGTSKDTYYYVSQNDHGVVNALTDQAKISADRIVFSGTQFDVSKSNLIVKVHPSAIQGTELTIPNKYRGLGSDLLSEYYGTLTRVTFESGSQVTSIDPNAFRDGTSTNTDYYVNQNEQGVVNALADQAKISADHIVFSGIQFDVSKSNLIIKVHPSAIQGTELIIPNKCRGLGPDLLSEDCGTLRRVTFESGSQITWIDRCAFRKGTSSNTDYYVNQNDQGVVNALADQAKISTDRIVFSGTQFDVSKSNLIVKVHPSTIQGTELIIPNKYRGLGPDLLSEYYGTLTRVTFESGSQVTSIDRNAFRKGTSPNTDYYVKQDDQTVVNALKNTVANNDHIVIQGKIFTLNGAGLIVNVTTDDTSLIIPSSIDNTTIMKIKTGAFQDCRNLRRIEFDQNIFFLKVNVDAFKGLDKQTILYVYDKSLAKNFASVTQLEIGVARDAFFFVNKNDQWDGLTKQGRQQTELKIPRSITRINLNAFDGCSSSLNKITIEGDKIDIDENVWKTKSVASIVDKLQFYVHNEKLRQQLHNQGINVDHVHIVKRTGWSPTKIAVVVVSVCFAVLLFGLGIDLPLRKRYKTNKA